MCKNDENFIQCVRFDNMFGTRRLQITFLVLVLDVKTVVSLIRRKMPTVLPIKLMIF